MRYDKLPLGILFMLIDGEITEEEASRYLKGAVNG